MGLKQRKKVYSKAIQAVAEAFKVALAEGDTAGAVAFSKGIRTVMLAGADAFRVQGEIALGLAEKLQDLEREGSENLH